MSDKDIIKNLYLDLCEANINRDLEKLNEIHQQKFNKELMINYQEYLVPYSSVNDKILQYFVESGGEEWDNDTYAILIDELN